MANRIQAVPTLILAAPAAARIQRRGQAPRGTVPLNVTPRARPPTRRQLASSNCSVSTTQTHSRSSHFQCSGPLTQARSISTHLDPGFKIPVCAWKWRMPPYRRLAMLIPILTLVASPPAMDCPCFLRCPGSRLRSHESTETPDGLI